MTIVFLRRVLVASVAFSVTACAGPASTSVAPANQTLGGAQASQTASLQRRPSRSQGSYPVDHPLLFVANQNNAAVAVYRLREIEFNRAPLAQLPATSGCPFQPSVDHNGTVYVPNCAANSLNEFPKGSTTPSLTITSGLSIPSGTAVDRSGNLYVSNYPPAITVYPPGATAPSETITGGGLSAPFGLAVDGHGDLFIADTGAEKVFEVPSGKTTPQALDLQNLTDPIQLAVARDGDLWVTDGEGKRVQVYRSHQTMPYRTLTGFSFPYAVAVDERGVGFIADTDQNVVLSFHPGANGPSGRLSNGINGPTGLATYAP